MFERKILDYNKCEIDRFIHYNNKKEISFISFKVSRKNPEYEPNLYPPVSSGEPALTYEQWTSGENKEPIKKEIHTLKNKYVTKSDIIDVNEFKNEGVKKEEVNKKIFSGKSELIDVEVNGKKEVVSVNIKNKDFLSFMYKEISQNQNLIEILTISFLLENRYLMKRSIISWLS